ncbi:MAG: hypothetical protein ACLQG3_15365 [Terracidiphilus sp.]
MIQQTFVKKLIGVVPFLALVCGTLAWGQVQPAAIKSSGLNVFASFGGYRTHVINDTYNALGIDGGFYVQRSARLGFEVRGGSFSMYARYSQSPVTAGYRTQIPGPRWHSWLFSGYFGGGMSLSQDAGPHYVPKPAQWSPCWQASQGLTIDMGPWKWSPYEATWTSTYTPLRTLSAYSLKTGVVYTFSRSRRLP